MVVAKGRNFEWDDAKAASNLAKHGVSFTYATRVFLDAALIDLDAFQPGDREIRRKAIGMIEGRIFTVVYTVRGSVVRIISARRCSAKEGKAYGSVHSRSE
jgi:uncharacterized DUF497 family protein